MGNKIKEPMNRARNATVRIFEMFVYSIIKITRLYDYQTWLTHFFEKFERCAKVCGLFFLDCALQMLIDWAEKLRLHGCNV